MLCGRRREGVDQFFRDLILTPNVTRQTDSYSGINRQRSQSNKTASRFGLQVISVLTSAAALLIKCIPWEVKMELSAVYRCVAALEVHQAKLTVCVLSENEWGEDVSHLREFGGFKRDRREMAFHEPS
ncbi:MAG: hypothetical protein CTY29_13145 [Methylobacter sp.]|nr:MAG: hypothetical protein CTY29_13145 [Methylobacter sp.]